MDTSGNTVVGYSNQSPLVRSVLLVSHTYRSDSAQAISQVIQCCAKYSIAVTVMESIAPIIDTTDSHISIASGDNPAQAVDMVLSLGGDGTFLKAAALAREAKVPVLGVNLGHVGFLAESEFDTHDEVVQQIAHGNYGVEERMTVAVQVSSPNGETLTDWALNEASIERGSDRGVLGISVAVDDRPVLSFGCDGLLVSTPTGSTAYAFSAGGPVLWPELDALLVQPNNAHALFARPLVVAPTSQVAVDITGNSGTAELVLDGQRSIDLQVGSHISVGRSEVAVRWVKVDPAPFADRLVRKFDLPVTGWRD